MDVAAAHAHIREILLKLLRHPLGERRHEHPLVCLGADPYLLKQVIHLVLRRAHLNRRVKQPGRAHNLFYHKAFRLFEFILGRSRAHKDLLSGQRLELLELQRPVVGGCREAESVVNQHLLPRMVASVHRANLRNRHMALVDESDEILREIVHQAERAHTLLAAVEIARIILDAGAIAHLFNHLKVIFHPLFQPLGLHPLAVFQQLVVSLLQVVLNHAHRLRGAFLRRHEIVCRIYRNFIDVLNRRSRNWVNHSEPVNLVTEKLDAYRVIAIANAYVHRVPAHPESSSLEVGLRPRIECIHKLIEQPREASLLAASHHNSLRMKVFRVADAVETGDAGNHNHVPAAGHQGGRRAQAELLDFVVDAQILFYIGVGRRDICFRLIVVIVGDEIFDGVVRKE